LPVEPIARRCVRRRDAPYLQSHHPARI
jgi:hypothetical protein